ncbi:MAG TPA: response regulator transcription factor [Thermoanaerobaculia bacterium]|jgi:two-component system nitrate/nitrite response regulator NarL|nr:response regulator transcription factor [Thermoanaerobaculia bacterium]
MSTTSWGTASAPAPPPPERSPPPAIRVLLVGDDPLARGGLAFLLAGEPGLVVVAQADAAGAAAAAERDEPQAAVWDLGADPLGWLERLGAFGETGPPAVALLLDEEPAAAALAAGARGLLFRDAEAGRLAAALRALARGLLVFDDSLLPSLLRPPAAPQTQPDPLTPRELEVVQLLAQGLSNRRIAERLGISEHTAKFHVNSIVGKLGAQTRTDAAIRAARLGLVLL